MLSGVATNTKTVYRTKLKIQIALAGACDQSMNECLRKGRH